MATTHAWYFAYGSNMSRAHMRSRAGTVLSEQPARLENYELIFNKKARGGTGAANIRLSPGRVVHGVLYQIPEAAFTRLERFENAPEHYRRIEVNVTDSAGKKLHAQVYIATPVAIGLRQ